jgi:hypothetical protein
VSLVTMDDFLVLETITEISSTISWIMHDRESFFSYFMAGDASHLCMCHVLYTCLIYSVNSREIFLILRKINIYMSLIWFINIQFETQKEVNTQTHAYH